MMSPLPASMSNSWAPIIPPPASFSYELSSSPNKQISLPSVNPPPIAPNFVGAQQRMPNYPNSPLITTPNISNPMGADLNDFDFDFENAFSSDNSMELQQSASCHSATNCGNTEPIQYNGPELLSSTEITPIYVKSRNRYNFAALLVERLFDVPTRLRSNVTGRGKERLDPNIIRYIKTRIFEFYECPLSNIDDEWKKCINDTGLAFVINCTLIQVLKIFHFKSILLMVKKSCFAQSEVLPCIYITYSTYSHITVVKTKFIVKLISTWSSLLLYYLRHHLFKVHNVTCADFRCQGYPKLLYSLFKLFQILRLVNIS